MSVETLCPSASFDRFAPFAALATREVARFEALLVAAQEAGDAARGGGDITLWATAIAAGAALWAWEGHAVAGAPHRTTVLGAELYELHRRGETIFERTIREAVAALPGRVRHFALQGRGPAGCTMGLQAGAEEWAPGLTLPAGAYLRLRRGTPEEVSRWAHVAL